MNVEAPIVEERIYFESESLKLEGALAYPECGSPAFAVALFAPHPHLGGNMENNVIRRTAHRAAAGGAATLRFNYRGVGASEIRLVDGESRFNHWERMETERRYEELVPDCLAAVTSVKSAACCDSVRVVGYSLGAILAGMIAHDPSVDRVIAISPPVGRVPLNVFESCYKPKLFIAGDGDVFAPPGLLEKECQSLPRPLTVARLTGCDHFYRKDEDRLYEAIKATLFSADTITQ